MNPTIKNVVLPLFFLLAVLSLHGQPDNYKYQSPILNAQKGWNHINLTAEVFDRLENNLHDIRIYHRQRNGKKVREQPYIIDIESGLEKTTYAAVKIINRTSKDDTHSFTLDMANISLVNRILLTFSNSDFDWTVLLEGGMSLTKWEPLLKEYRIVSLQRNGLVFKHTDLDFSPSKYKYYRITIRSEKKPRLVEARVAQTLEKASIYNPCPIRKIDFDEDANSKNTFIDIELMRTMPVGQMRIEVKNDQVYFRPFIIEGVVDSVQTEKGWKYHYQSLKTGSINSFSESAYTFDPLITNKLRLSIYNYDNPPLDYGTITVQGPNYRLNTRLDTTENVFMVVGNPYARTPSYDIAYFKANIPDSTHEATLGPFHQVSTPAEEKVPLFNNKWWLWGIMVIIILLLGGFSLKMIRQQTPND